MVRDKVPQIILADGAKPVTRVLSDKEYLKELIKKLKEEVAEFEAERSIKELADIKELLIAIRQLMGLHAGQLEDARRKKAASNGRFKKKIFLKSVEKGS